MPTEGELRTEVTLHKALRLGYISLVQGPVILGVVQYNADHYLTLNQHSQMELISIAFERMTASQN